MLKTAKTSTQNINHASSMTPITHHSDTSEETTSCVVASRHIQTFASLKSVGTQCKSNTTVNSKRIQVSTSSKTIGTQCIEHQLNKNDTLFLTRDTNVQDRDPSPQGYVGGPSWRRQDYLRNVKYTSHRQCKATKRKLMKTELLIYNLV